MFDDIIKENYSQKIYNYCCICHKQVEDWFHATGFRCSDECNEEYVKRWNKMIMKEKEKKKCSRR